MPNKPPQFTLVMDASNPACFIGLLDRNHSWLAHRSIEGPALETIFPSLEAILSEVKINTGAIDRYLYCEGPGSTLGLRLAAMAIRTWRALQPEPPPCLAYNSLRLAANCLLLDEPTLTDALLVADWKKDTWNAVIFEKGQITTCEPITAAALEAWKGPSYHLPQRKGWQSPPPHATTLRYTPERLNEMIDIPGFLQGVDSPKPFASTPPNFQKWIPGRHRVPSTDA